MSKTCLSGDFCCLLITFSNSLDPDQDRHDICPDLNTNHLTLIVFQKEVFEKVSRRQEKHEKLPSMHYFFRDEVTYRIDRGGTKRGNDKLVDSLGFSYTLKVWLA